MILIDAGAPREGWWKELQDRFCREAGTEQHEPGLSDVAELEPVMSDLGLSGRTLPAISHRSTRTMEERIRWLEEGMFSFTWPLDEPTRRRAAAGIRGWAAERFGPLDEPRTVDTQIVWRAFDRT